MKTCILKWVRSFCLFVSGVSYAMVSLAMPIQPMITAPAEFEPQAAVWLAWPQYEPIAGHSNIPQVIAIATAVQNSNEIVDLIVNDAKEVKIAHDYFVRANLDLTRVRLHQISHTDFWMRDSSAIFVKDAFGRLKAVALKFNSWGMAAVSNTFRQSSKIDQAIAKQMGDAFQIPVIRSSLIAEGGAFEFNGKGTLIVSESVILQKQRNPGFTKETAEAELKHVFGLKKIIWLKQGIVADDSTFYGPINSPTGPALTALTTNGHTDEYVRWVNDDTVLLAQVTEAEAATAGKHSILTETRRRLERNYQILIHSTTQDGKPIKVIRIPVAEEIYHVLKPGDSTFDAVLDMKRADHGHTGELILKGQRRKSALFASANSYLNYLITNNAVLIPQYWAQGLPESVREKDEAAKAIIQAAFPNRKLIVIKNIDDINIGGGGIHCITQQVPL